MKNKRFIILFMVALISCSKDDQKPTAPASDPNDDEIVVETQSILFDPEFTDLMDLPKDTGGQHTANPISSLLSPLGHYIYTPSGYDNNDHSYPLLVFLHGGGQRGNSFENANDLEKVLAHGPPFMINSSQWDPKFPCIVASPQIGSGNWSPSLVDGFIRHLLGNYRINKTRIYLTGLSLGGRGTWSYIGQKGNEGFVSAIVPICGSGDPSQIDKLSTVPIWAFHGAEDNIISAFNQNGSVPMVEEINQNNPVFTAKVTIYPNVGHDSWTQTYSGSGMGAESTDYSVFNMSIYNWMFQYRKEK
ncbi:hypothetical protein DKG77_07165 [Flagellimonas aquimarina]|uniref:Dienelactone hydrolase domain-containing protein n=1 Tax=Flagellimonas aquimarina TaxID=2201895 RepID=A0A316KWP8_9FLAO|nr:dienelactone hydrolase family protein [Allomuricauda koreensis]PWL38066.1 hypothetical protein DKG77_07165 [Allomuricauda koreensis]